MREHKVEVSDRVVIASEINICIVDDNRLLQVALVSRSITVDNPIAVPVVEI